LCTKQAFVIQRSGVTGQRLAGNPKTQIPSFKQFSMNKFRKCANPTPSRDCFRLRGSRRSTDIFSVGQTGIFGRFLCCNDHAQGQEITKLEIEARTIAGSAYAAEHKVRFFE
jgi:hypothetical protein